MTHVWRSRSFSKQQMKISKLFAINDHNKIRKWFIIIYKNHIDRKYVKVTVTSYIIYFVWKFRFYSIELVCCEIFHNSFLVYLYVVPFWNTIIVIYTHVVHDLYIIFPYRGTTFGNGVVGKAIKGTICTFQFSGGVNLVCNLLLLFCHKKLLYIYHEQSEK